MITIKPANRAASSDLVTVLGAHGSAAECQCQRYRLERGESFANTPVEARAERLLDQAACGDSRAPRSSGLIAFLDDEPVGWCAVAPRAEYSGLVRNSNQTAWRGRQEDRSDPAVWAVTCVFTRVGYRGRGVATALAAATPDFARAGGARRVEAYPITVADARWGEEHPGPLGIYLEAGFTVIHRPSKRRAVVSIDV
ncbi:N-acetyltransferase family protein [Flexivirga sp. B27]